MVVLFKLLYFSLKWVHPSHFSKHFSILSTQRTIL